MDKLEIKKALRKALEIKTIIFILAVSMSLIYYAKCYAQNQVLIFKKDSSVILLGFFIMSLWTCSFCLFLLYENRRLLKVIIKKDETIELLLNELVNKTNAIQEQNKEVIEATEVIMEQNEENYDNLMNFNKNTREILLDRSDRIAN